MGGRSTRARMKILEAQLYSTNAGSVILSRAKESATCAVERSLFSARSARFKRFLLFSQLRERRKPRAQATSWVTQALRGSPRIEVARVRIFNAPYAHSDSAVPC